MQSLLTSAIITLSVSPCLARYDAEAPFRPPVDFSVTFDFDDTRGPDSRDPFFPRNMGGTIKRKNKEWVANHVEFNHPKYRGSKDKRADQEDALVFGLSIRYPELRQSNIVPVFGRLYKVDIVVPKRTDRKHVINFTWIGHNLGNLDHALSEYSFQVPLNSGVGCITTVRGHSLRLTQIESLKDKPGEFVASFKNDQRYEAKHAPTRVKVGDLLMIGERGHRVLAVVPRDEKTGVIGWVEFDPEPLTVAAIKDKGWGDRIVWPEK